MSSKPSWTSEEWSQSVSSSVRESTLLGLEELRRRHGQRFWNVLRVLSEIDPEELISIGAPPDEYVHEALVILRQMPDVASTSDVKQIVKRVLMEWFGSVPSEDRLDVLARRLWNEWRGDKDDAG